MDSLAGQWVGVDVGFDPKKRGSVCVAEDFVGACVYVFLVEVICACMCSIV